MANKLGSKISVPAKRSRFDMLKARRRIILGVLIFTSICGLFATWAWLQKPEIPVPQIDGVTSPSVAMAQQVAEDFIAGRATNVPIVGNGGVEEMVPGAVGNFSGATGLTGIARKPLYSDSIIATVPGVSGEVNMVRFLVIADHPTGVKDSKGQPVKKSQFYQLSVPMQLTANVPNPVLAANPTIMPYLVVNAGSSIVDFENSELKKDLGSIQAQVQTPIGVWAKAFAAAGTDPNLPDNIALKRVTGDQTESSFYIGLGGWALTGVDIIAAALPPAGDDGVPQAGTIVRVALTVTPKGSTSGSVSSIYDVWVMNTAGTDQDNSPVVAWAPAGDYSKMEPYMNARKK